MKDKSCIILGVVIFTLFSLNIAKTYGRYTKTVTKTGTIATADVGYCKSKNITSFKECLIRNDSQQELNDALNTISLRSNSVNFANVEPIGVYIPKTTYTNIENKTNATSIAATNMNRFTYVIENKLITEFDVDDTDITKIKFNPSTGYYTYTDYQVGNIKDIVTTAEDIEKGIYKYTCLSTTTKSTSLYLFTEEPYLMYNAYRFKQGYKYSYQVVGTSSSNPGLYKGEDDYTTYEDNVAKDNFTYYYRGDVQNNWVSFGNFLWRIIRINGDGSIRMIYSGLKSATNHTGYNAQIGTAMFGDTSTKTATTADATGLTNDIITTTYTNSMYGNTYVGYMYNPEKEIATYPNKIVGSSNTDAGGWRLNYFPIFNNISDPINYYFFKNFDPSTDCFTGRDDDDNGACTLKCKALGDDGDSGIDCIQSNWNTLATTSGNYSTTDPGVYSTNYVYKSNYKYTCWSYGTPVLHNNSDGTTSVYITCPIVSEIVGTVKDRPTQAKVKYHGLFSKDATTANTNVKDSNVKTKVDTWYASNILNKTDVNNNLLESYLSDEIFCNDRTSDSSTFPLASGNSSYNYGSYTRNVTNRNPSFKCPNLSNDGFTLKMSGATSIVKASGSGNNVLNYPIGLITIDEAAFAGGSQGYMNQKYYLYTGSNYWTMSPYDFNSNNASARALIITANGGSYAYGGNQGIRPVINLKSDVLYASGIGTENDPYIITIK